MSTQERYTPKPLAANSTSTFSADMIGGFLCSAAGTITITAADGTVLLNSFPVTAGASHPFSMFLPVRSVTVVLGGGAAGTLMVN